MGSGQMHRQRGDHYGSELREADALHAERLLQAELERRGWAQSELSRRRKGDMPGMSGFAVLKWIHASSRA